MPLESITEKSYDDIFNINVKGVLFTVQKALPIFNDGASIILNASFLSIKGGPATSVYIATKAAVRSFARCWCVDLKDRKIRVNVLVQVQLIHHLRIWVIQKKFQKKLLKKLQQLLLWVDLVNLLKLLNQFYF